MKTSKFTDEQIAMALRQAEAGTRVGEMCRKLGVSEPSFYRWKKRFGALGVSNERGQLVPKADAPALAAALHELMRDPELGQELGRRGRDFVRHHSQLDAIVRQHEQVYDQVLGLSQVPTLAAIEARH